jgi:hypothetical protein
MIESSKNAILSDWMTNKVYDTTSQTNPTVIKRCATA